MSGEEGVEPELQAGISRQSRGSSSLSTLSALLKHILQAESPIFRLLNPDERGDTIRDVTAHP